MSYCPECGEKATEADLFCSYCGISLKPIIEPQPQIDDSMSETIIAVPVNLSDESKLQEKNAENLTQSAVEETRLEPETPAFPTFEGESEYQVNETGFSPGKTVENWSMKTELVDIPPEVLKPEVLKQEASSLPTTTEASSLPTTTEDKKNKFSLSEASSAFEESGSQFQKEAESLAEIPAPSVIRELEARQENLTPPKIPGLSSDENEPASFSQALNETEEDEKANKQIRQDTAEDSDKEDVDEKVESALSLSDSGITESEELATNKAASSAEFQASEKVSGVENKEQTSLQDLSTPAELAKDESVSESPILTGQVPKKIPAESPFMSLEVEFREDKSLSEEDSSKKTPAVKMKSEKDLTSQSKDSSYGETDGRKAAKLKPLAEGTILNGRYEIVRKIGGGGMGAVYLALDQNLGSTKRAVKEMVQSYIEAEQQEKAISDFQREAMILSELDHPSIPTIYDYFFDESEGRFYLVMKYISGGDLAGHLRAAPEGRLDEKTVTEWAIQIADVLDYLHRQDPVIVYRDLKPANIMVDGKTGRVMLIDFGIARSINKEEKGVTAVGTMGYAPPELFSGNVEPRSDIYSLGSTMFHLLTGADPQSNPLLIFDFQKNPRPRQINPLLSDQIEQIIMKAVEYNAEMRFASAAEMRDVLTTHLQNLQTAKVTFGIKAAPAAVAFSEQVVFCGFCGDKIIASDIFCPFCGAKQPIGSQNFQSLPFAASKGTAKLFVLGTDEIEVSGFSLDKEENLIGRRDPMSNIFPEIDLSKYDPQTKISRRHARIWREGNQFMLEDLGSSNGTVLLTGSTEKIRLLPHHPRPLNNGDKIRVGDTTLQFTTS